MLDVRGYLRPRFLGRFFAKVNQPIDFEKVNQPIAFGRVNQPIDFGKVNQPVDFGKVNQPIAPFEKVNESIARVPK